MFLLEACKLRKSAYILYNSFKRLPLAEVNYSSQAAVKTLVSINLDHSTIWISIASHRDNLGSKIEISTLRYERNGASTFHVGVRLFDSSHWWAAGRAWLAGASSGPGRPRGCSSRRILKHKNQVKTVLINKWLSFCMILRWGTWGHSLWRLLLVWPAASITKTGEERSDTEWFHSDNIYGAQKKIVCSFCISGKQITFTSIIVMKLMKCTTGRRFLFWA